MIPITYIRRNVGIIDTKYRAATIPLHNLLYAKLAIIEVGGWTEVSMDDLVLRAGAKLKDTTNIQLLEGKIVDRNWGFDYKKNFRNMMTQTVGLVTLEKIEKKVNGTKHTKLIAALGLLKDARNSVAHTYIKKIAISNPIPAPSVTNTYLNDIYDGLKEIENVMRQLRLI